MATLERVDAIRAAVRAHTSAVFESMGGPDELGFGTVSSAVQARLRVTRGKARSYRKLAKQYGAHRLIMDAMKGADLRVLGR